MSWVTKHLITYFLLSAYQLFLQQYLSYFERERIGLVELPHITEEQLIQLGIPMGPRQRIIDEAAKL